MKSVAHKKTESQLRYIYYTIHIFDLAFQSKQPTTRNVYKTKQKTEHYTQKVLRCIEIPNNLCALWFVFFFSSTAFQFYFYKT